uniref:Uncharacterized protein n=1 Tax=Arundo donax TaxID=35708 RepID=A0A0A9CIG8_ARUDO
MLHPVIFFMRSCIDNIHIISYLSLYQSFFINAYSFELNHSSPLLLS